MRTFVDHYHPEQPPLPGWDRPRPGEPAHGFVVRLAEMNRRSSVAAMLVTHGLNGRAIRPDECLAFALSLPFQGREDLIDATPVVSDDDVVVRGQTIRRRHWQITRRRFCPACLAEDAYHRVWWDLPDFRRCPHHGLDLVDHDEGGHVVPWWFPSFARSPRGKSMARHGVPRRSTPVPSIEAYILGRLGGGPEAGLSLLDGLADLGEAIDVVRMLGRIALWGRNRARPAGDDDGTNGIPEVMSAGFAVARRGETGVLALLHEVAAARAETNGRAKKTCFGWVRENVWGEQNSRGISFGRLIDRVMAERNRGLATPHEGASNGETGWIPLPLVASRIGMSVNRVRQVSQALGIHAPCEKHARNRYLMLTAQEADLIQRTIETLIDRDAVSQSLGLRRSLVDGLVAAGVLVPFAGIGMWRNKLHFRPEEVAAFADRLLSGSVLVSPPPEGFVRLATLARTHRTDPSGVVAGLLDGGPSSRARTGSLVGDLLVPVEARRWTSGRRPKPRVRRVNGNEIGRYQAASLLGCTARTVDALLRAGLVASAGNGGRRIDPASLMSFCRRWAPAGLYREVLKLKAGDRLIGSCLERRGVNVLRVPLPDGQSTYLAERASARAVLGIKHDPDAREGGGTKAFETAVVAELMERGTFRRSGLGECLAVISTAGDLALRVRLRAREETVVLDLTRDSAKGTRIDERLTFARKAAADEIHVRRSNGRLRATMLVPVPEISDPTTWPQLAKRVADGLDLFRKAFPSRRNVRIPA